MLLQLGSLTTQEPPSAMVTLVAVPARELRQNRHGILGLRYLTLSSLCFLLYLPFLSSITSCFILSSLSKLLIESFGSATLKPFGKGMACEHGAAGRRYELLILALPMTHPVFRS